MGYNLNMRISELSSSERVVSGESASTHVVFHYFTGMWKSAEVNNEARDIGEALPASALLST